MTCVLSYQYGMEKASTNKPEQVKKEETTDKEVQIVTEIVERPGEKITTIKEVEVVKTVNKVDIKEKKLDWSLSMSKSLNKDNEYMFQVNRRIVGDVFVGAYGTTNSNAGITIGVSF
jgi:hypothetical protein